MFRLESKLTAEECKKRLGTAIGDINQINSHDVIGSLNENTFRLSKRKDYWRPMEGKWIPYEKGTKIEVDFVLPSIGKFIVYTSYVLSGVLILLMLIPYFVKSNPLHDKLSWKFILSGFLPIAIFLSAAKCIEKMEKDGIEFIITFIENTMEAKRIE